MFAHCCAKFSVDFRLHPGHVHLHGTVGSSGRVVDDSRPSWHVVVHISYCDVWEVKGWFVTSGKLQIAVWDCVLFVSLSFTVLFV